MNKKNEAVTPEISLEELGETMRQQRDKQQLTLQDCAERLKIRHRYLDSLEQGLPDGLPGDVFYVNFVKSYATALGLDGEDFAGKARHALQAQGRLNELKTVMQHRSSEKNKNEKTPMKVAPTSATLSLPVGEASLQTPLRVPLQEPLQGPLGVASLPHSLDGRLSAPSIADSATEKQMVREILLSPLFVIGGLIAAVLLYLGTVIVSDLLGEGDSVVSVERAVSLEVDKEQARQEVADPIEDEVRAARIYGAVGSARVELWAKETCWIAVFATDTSLGKRERVALLFAETLLEGDRYRVPAELGIVLKGGNLSCLTFVVQGAVIDPFRVPNPSGFISLEPSHLRTRMAMREGGVLARERLPVVLEIELLRQQRAEQALELEGGKP